MSRKLNTILDLLSYKRYPFETIINEKFNTSVLDEGGLSSPLAISLVIPIKFASKGILELEEDTLQRVLSQCSELVDVGYLDEIIIMGATLDEKGVPDFSILQDVVKIAYEELGLFREQVDLLNKYKSQNQRAKRGLTDFFLKVIHQYDENIPKLLARFGVFGATGHFGILPGKGSGIWMSVPIAQGDILVFVDSDIMNFQKEYIAGLCHPIVYSWNVQEAAVKFVKAYYTRLTITKEKSQTPYLGGRICRLLTLPLLKSVVEIFGIYQGLDAIKFPLAGEFAVSRDLMESFYFPNTYAVETSLLFQSYDLVGPSSMAQVDLEIYRHIGRGFEILEPMAHQIVDLVLRVIDEKLGRPLTNEEKEQMVVSYERNVTNLFKNFEEQVVRAKKFEDNLTYSPDDESQKKKVLENIVIEALSGKLKEKIPRYYSLSSWQSIKKRINNYFVLQDLLRRRGNQSTWSRLRECKLLKT